MLTSPRKGPIHRDDQYHYQRERRGDYHGHYHMHAKIVKAEQVGETHRNDAAGQDGPPDHVPDVPFNGREAAGARAVEFVQRLEQLGLDDLLTHRGRLNGYDGGVQFVWRRPALVRSLSVALHRPFLIDDGGDVLLRVVTDRLAHGGRQSLRVAIDAADRSLLRYPLYLARG